MSEDSKLPGVRVREPLEPVGFEGGPVVVEGCLRVGEVSGDNGGMRKSAFRRGAAFVEGDYVPIAEAKISILDTGFSRSDVTYDVVAAWNGAFFRLDDHLERFERNCAALRMQLPFDRTEIAAILTHLVGLSGLRSSYVDILHSRSAARRFAGSKNVRKSVLRLRHTVRMDLA